MPFRQPTYHHTGNFSNSLLDTDSVLNRFCEECVDAGRRRCALFETTAQAVRSRIDNVLNALKTHPLPVSVRPTHQCMMGDEDVFVSDTYGLVDYGLAHRVVFGFLYAPYGGSPLIPWISTSVLAHALAAAEGPDADGRPLFELRHEERLSCQCPSAPRRADLFAGSVAVACGESEPVYDTVEELQAQWNEMAKTSSFADVWPMRARCLRWPFRTRERFAGTFLHALVFLDDMLILSYRPI